MLLRASRLAGHVKEALVGAIAKKVLKKTWKPLGAVAVGGAVAGPQIASDVGRARLGLSQPYIEASRAGLVPTVPRPEFSKVPGTF